MNGNHKLIQQFLVDGINYMFGNPGTVEEGFLDVLDAYEDFHYITCLQESVAVAMADGYARKSKKASVVQLHSGVGLGNGIGMLYQAMRGHSPLVVIAGEAGIRYEALDAQMACNLVDMAKPVTKWAGRVVHKDSLLRMVRRAVKIALTPPQGPVFLALPLDVMDEENNEEVVPTVHLHSSAAACAEDIKEAARLLLLASNPVLIIGDGVCQSGAQKAMEELAEVLGAKVYGADYSQYNFNTANPLFQGALGHMFGENSQSKLKDADVVLIAGTYVFPEVFPCIGKVFRKEAKVIHIDLNAYEIAKNHPVDLGIVADPKATVLGIVKQVRSIQTHEQKKEAKERKERLHKSMTPLDNNNLVEVFIERLSRNIGEDYIIFDEALTSSALLEKYFPMKKEGDYYQTRGGSLGVGIPGAMGMKLASKDSMVVAFTGDGGSMYTIQAIHTAVRYNVDIKIVILNNRSYRLLKNNIEVYRKAQGVVKDTYPDCFDLKPAIDFSKLAQSMGVLKTAEVKDVSQVREVVKEMTRSKGVFLVDLRVT